MDAIYIDIVVFRDYSSVNSFFMEGENPFIPQTAEHRRQGTAVGSQIISQPLPVKRNRYPAAALPDSLLRQIGQHLFPQGAPG